MWPPREPLFSLSDCMRRGASSKTITKPGYKKNGGLMKRTKDVRRKGWLRGNLSILIRPSNKHAEWKPGKGWVDAALSGVGRIKM